VISTEDLLADLPRPIAVVGNGSVDLKGEEIDSHASVIRINNYRILGYENWVGSKIGVWCVNCWWDLENRTPSVPVCTPFHAEDDSGRILRWEARYGVDLIKPERRWSEEVRGIKAKKPSTGLLLLFALDSLGIPADAYGFDGLVAGHYWDRAHKHDHPEERSALDSLTLINYR